MSDLAPWSELARPRPDIADGTFDESLFAADLGLVARGRGPTDYLDPVAFCEKTYLTANLRQALLELAQRLAGHPAAAGVYRLQTEFGGGKTHTLLAAYHLFGNSKAVAHTQLSRELAAAAGLDDIPQARVVVLDGSALMAGAPERHPDGTEIHTYLGHIAYGLGGRTAYDELAAQDAKKLGTSTEQLAQLLAAHAPCLILMDETLEYLNKALAVRTHDGNLAATTLTTIKELCTAASNVPGVAVLATLTSSRMEDYATVAGEEMQERLSKVVGRTENIVTPVEGDDIFPILHRRLFETVGTEAERRVVADAYADYYASQGDALPAGYSGGDYRDRLVHAFPFHPELVDILTNRWGSLSGFQRTRGALRTLAHTVKALSQRRHGGSLILAGDVPLEDAGLRAEVLRFAGETYKSALNADIIRSASKAPEEDRRRGGQVERERLATGLATSALLYSFGPDKVLGASAAQMLLAVGRPGISRSLIEDVRDTLENLLWYMRLEAGRYRFTTEPNLNKVVLEREQAFDDVYIDRVLRDALASMATSDGILRVEPWVTESTHLADEPRLTLGILDFSHRANGVDAAETSRFAQGILEHRGSSFRANKNAAMLVAADHSTLLKARAAARTLEALQDLSKDKHRLARFNAEQKEQLSRRLAGAEERLPQLLVMAYRHLLLLSAKSEESTAIETVDLGPARADATIPGRVLEWLRGADRIVDSLTPAALLSPRFGLLPDDANALELDALPGYFAQMPRLPKLTSPQVLVTSLCEGVEKRLFGLASGSAWDAPDALLRFGVKVAPSEVAFQPGTWLVRASAMSELLRVHPVVDAPVAPTPTAEPPSGVPIQPPATEDDGDDDGGVGPTAGGDGGITHVRIAVDKIPGSKMREVLRAAIMPLGANGADVSVTLVIEADACGGSVPKETLDLVVAEGLRQLGLDVSIETS